MAKLKLDFEIEIDFFLLGISCHLPSYRFAHILNDLIGIDLERKEDLDLKLSKKNDKGYFTFYQYDNEESYTTIHLIGNRCEKGHFASELKQMDYFLQLWLPNSEEEELRIIKEKITTCPQVIACMDVDANGLKSKNNFLF